MDLAFKSDVASLYILETVVCIMKFVLKTFTPFSLLVGILLA